jgi:hypothetical protein
VPATASRRSVAASRGVPLHFRDASPEDQDGYGFRPTRTAFRRPAGTHPPSLASVRRPGRAPHALAAPSETSHCSPAPQRHHRPEGRTATRPAMQPLLGFRALRHSLGSADPPERGRRFPPPPRTTCGVWLPPSRHPPPNLPAREAPERPWASHFKVFPSYASGAPLGARALLTLPAARAPRGETSGSGRLQGLVPATSPCCRRLPEGNRPSIPSCAFPLQSLLPIRPGPRL